MQNSSKRKELQDLERLVAEARRMANAALEVQSNLAKDSIELQDKQASLSRYLRAYQEPMEAQVMRKTQQTQNEGRQLRVE